MERDGYYAVQIGFEDKPRNKAIRSERGHVAADFVSKRRQQMQAAGVTILDKPNCEPQKFIREFRLTGEPATTVGAVLTAAEVFKEVMQVDVIGTSKGHGFAGVMKRHNFQGLPAAHGAKKVHRTAGSISSHSSNRGDGRPKLGHKAAGHLGHARITVRNLQIVKIDPENNVMLVRGAVPGPNGGFVTVRPTNKKKIAAPVKKDAVPAKK